VGTLEKESHMVTAEEIAAMSIEEIKANFFDLMDRVVTTYGDNQEQASEQQEGEGDAAKK